MWGQHLWARGYFVASTGIVIYATSSIIFQISLDTQVSIRIIVGNFTAHVIGKNLCWVCDEKNIEMMDKLGTILAFRLISFISVRMCNGGGILIQDKFLLNKTFIAEDEQKQILFSLQSISATELIDTARVFGRLRSLFERQ